VRTDLNSYLELPNVFSPNSDDTNDELALIYKSVYELQTFEIYNRWGQKVFDAEGDLDKTWDGTFNGKEQPLGVYTAVVKATGSYDKFYHFTKNVTLIR
jgi:gliding motility-associated-like protein